MDKHAIIPIQKQKLPYEGKFVKIPTSVAKCPMCGKPVYADVMGWETVIGKPYWVVAEFHLYCESETKDLLRMDCHADMPYVHWLPLDHVVLDYLNKKLEERREKRNTQARQRRWLAWYAQPALSMEEEA